MKKERTAKSNHLPLFLIITVLLGSLGLWLLISSTDHPSPKRISAPQIHSGELPNIHGPSEAENLINTSSIIIKGAITDVEYLQFSDQRDQQSWFLTCFVLSAEEVIRGELQTSEVRVVSAAAFTGINPSDYVCNPLVAHCGIGTSGLFALAQPATGTAWTINGNSVSASTYGDFCTMTHYRVDDVTGTLYIMPWNRDLGITVKELQ